MNATEPVKPAGTDGAYLKNDYTATRSARGVKLDVWVHAVDHPGAELRRPHQQIAPPTRPRLAWLSYLAVAGVVLAADHGNVGAAILIAIWWFGWAVRRG